MTDITSKSLEAALLDQSVAGAFFDKTYAYNAVYNNGWQLGVAVANERGYHPIAGKTFEDQAEAKEWADGLNAHIGLTKDAIARIIISTMGGRAYRAAVKGTQGA
jgi:hypothetical protein